LLREAYERDLTFAAYRGIGKLQELINTQDFETKLQDCMKLALDEFRSHFLMAHLTTGTTAELNNTCPATAPKSLLQDEHSAAIGDFPNNETGSSSSAYMNNIAPQPNDWNIETNLDYDFPIEEAFQDWNWDILNCPPPETVSKDDIECLAAQSEIKMVTDNLTLDFPEPFNLTETIPPLDLHAPNLSKRELSYNNDEKARAAAARMAADT
jgi:hypothetical protein